MNKANLVNYRGPKPGKRELREDTTVAIDDSKPMKRDRQGRFRDTTQMRKAAGLYMMDPDVVKNMQ
jgi:hypothetical protein